MESNEPLGKNKFNGIFKNYLKDASDKELDGIKEYCENYLASYTVKSRLMELDYEEEKFNYLIKNTRINKKLEHFIDLFKGKGYDIYHLKKLKKSCQKDFDENFNLDSLDNLYFLGVVEPVYRYYQAFLEKRGKIDFNDMINKSIKIFQEKVISENYKYIFVDEYQDMSYKNFHLIETLKNKTNANLVIVGDDWQSIYGFRDSDLKLFTKFDEYYPNAKRVFIEKTYRNPQQLVDAAGNFIMKTNTPFKKSLKSDLSIEKPIKIIYHSQNEVDVINNLIYNLSEENDVMILGRYSKDIDEFLKGTNFIKKGSKSNYKKITNKSKSINNVEFRTIHYAKGLEADYVIIIRVIDDYGGFPNKYDTPPYRSLIQNWDNIDKSAEERRLFYVALTRAKKGVYIFTTQNKESRYISNLKEDSLKNLEFIYSNDKSTYSNFKEFKTFKQVKKVKSGEKTQFIDNIDDFDGIEIKAEFKKRGNKLIRSKNYEKTIAFYNNLLTNKYFVNDYYPYRKLVEVHRKNKDSDSVISTIKEFFKSELYCNESQLLWFKLEFKNACKYTNQNFNEFSRYLDYFNNHSLKNKDKQNIPVPIAARIKKSNDVMSQEDFDNLSKKKEVEYNYKFEYRYGSNKKALYYFEQLWDQEGFSRNLTAYKRLCSFYEDDKQYDKVIEISKEYFKSDARKTESSPEWFWRKIKTAESMLGIKHDKNYDKLIDKFTSDNQDKIITISEDDFSKLLGCHVGDNIIVKNLNNKYSSMKLVILYIKNQNREIKENSNRNIKISVNKKNFNIISKSKSIIIKHETLSGEIKLKHSR